MTDRMNPEIKTAWVEALRSDEYEQGTDMLVQWESGDLAYCCLGVLCDLAVKAGVEGVRFDSQLAQFEEYVPIYSDGSRADFDDEAEEEGLDRDWLVKEDEVLPSTVVRWAGLADDNPMVEEKNLSTWNDGSSVGDGLSFLAIADMIERNL